MARLTRFRDRAEAGRVLGVQLQDQVGDESAIVLGLARGGVPVACELARELDLPFDVFLVRKLGVPGHEELAMGAIASGGVRVVNEEVVAMLDLPPEVVDAVAREQGEELARRERAYRGDRPAADVAGRTAIVVDDGLATGSSMRAAVLALRRRGAGRIVVAVPVAPRETCAALESDADSVFCAYTPHPFVAVGAWYENFDQTSDDEVRALMAEAQRRFG